MTIGLHKKLGELNKYCGGGSPSSGSSTISLPPPPRFVTRDVRQRAQRIPEIVRNRPDGRRFGETSSNRGLSSLQPIISRLTGGN